MDGIIKEISKHIDSLNVTTIVLSQAINVLKEVDQDFFMSNEKLRDKLAIVDSLLNESIDLLKKIIG